MLKNTKFSWCWNHFCGYRRALRAEPFRNTNLEGKREARECNQSIRPRTANTDVAVTGVRDDGQSQAPKKSLPKQAWLQSSCTSINVSARWSSQKRRISNRTLPSVTLKPVAPTEVAPTSVRFKPVLKFKKPGYSHNLASLNTFLIWFKYWKWDHNKKGW